MILSFGVLSVKRKMKSFTPFKSYVSYTLSRVSLIDKKGAGIYSNIISENSFSA